MAQLVERLLFKHKNMSSTLRCSHKKLGVVQAYSPSQGRGGPLGLLASQSSHTVKTQVQGETEYKVKSG